jgi:hypothetical protein
MVVPSSSLSLTASGSRQKNFDKQRYYYSFNLGTEPITIATQKPLGHLILILGFPCPEQIIYLCRPRRRRARCQDPIATPRNIDYAAHLGLETRGKAMRIRPGNPGTRTRRERLGEEIDELPRTDELGKGMCAWLDEAKYLLCRYD